MFESLAIATALLILWYLFGRNPSPKIDLGISGKLVWLDKGRSTKPFFNKHYYVCGKLDLIYKRNNGLLGVEYKHRNGPVYESDIVQAKVAALAARDNSYPIKQILIKTRNTEKYIELPTCDEALNDQVATYINMVRIAKSGGALQARPTQRKCDGCGYSAPCKKH